MQNEEKDKIHWKRVYIGVLITGLIYILIFFWFTESFNLP